MHLRTVLAIVATAALLTAPRAGEPETAAARPSGPEPVISFMGASTAVHADISPPLRDIPPVLGGPPKTDADDPGPLTPCGPVGGVDPVAQTALPSRPGEAPRAMPAPGASWDAFPNVLGYSPPDPVGDVGPDHYVVMANSTMAVYSKTGTLLWGPYNNKTVWAGFGGDCETRNDGDPVVLYDQFADRWLVSQFTAGSSPYYNCVALSTTGDPTGTWQRYAFSNGNSFPDYPKYGVWRDGYYFSTRNTSGSTGQGAYALNRAQMLAGDLAPQVVNFLLSPGSTPYYGGDGLLPADADGSTLPPAGAPQLFIGTMDDGGPYGAPQDAINVFQFHVDWATPANSSFSRLATVPVAPFDSNFTPCGSGRSCIPQPGTTNELDILSYRQRATFRAAYRNFGTHESIALSQSVSGANSGTANAIAGMRWYELRDPNGTPSIYQQGTYVPGATDGVHRWMGSVAMDRMGNMGLGFSASSGTVYPSIWYTGRLATDPLGTMAQGEGSIVDGLGSQTGGGNRWGDYTALTVDPVDDCTFWYVNEYYTATSSSTWQMRVGSFTFPTCVCAATPAAPAATGAAAPADNTIALYWDDAAAASITQYYLFRATSAGGPYAQIATVPDASPGAGGSGTYTYDDTGVSGGIRYYYVIRANDGASCTSADSNEVDALATGACTLSPTFAGLTGLTSPGTAGCALDLSWVPAAPRCGTGVTYSVYRSTAPGFTPGDGNRIAQGVTGTSYADGSVAPGTTYSYIVRAFDTTSGSGDDNTAERSGAPFGPPAPTTYTASDVPKPVGPGSGTVESTLVVADTGLLSDVVVTLVNLTHTSDDNLDIFLVHPDGTLVELTTDNGGNGDNYINTVFDDSAATSITAGTAPFTGTFRPEGTLGMLDGKAANGTWRLRVTDDAPANAGTLSAWTLTLSTPGSCALAAPGEVAPGDVAATAQSWSADKGTHSWPAHPTAATYTVYRGTPGQLPGLLDGNTDSCTRYAGAATSFAAAEIPPPGSFYWYLVVGANTGGTGPAGEATAGARTVNATGSCP